MTEKRYRKVLAKYGSDENLHKNYISMKGKKIRDGEIDEPTSIKNRIRCIVTNRWCYITNQRIEANIKKYGSWEKTCENYISRPAKRLLKQGKSKDEIRKMEKLDYNNA
jgi:hypothetical protein